MNLTCLVTALAAESRPLIDHFQLKGVDAGALKLYRGDDILLLETGIGKLAAASALSALFERERGVRQVFNIGIAGGRAPFGQWYLAASVEDAGSGRRTYPHLPPLRTTKGIPALAVRTLDRPSDDYAEDALFDMELAGIAHAALRHLDTSALHALKVVSDNPESDMASVDRERVTALVASGLEIVTALIEWMRSIDHVDVEDRRLIEQWLTEADHRMHLSTYQFRWLRRIIERHVALHGTVPDLDALMAPDRHANGSTDRRQPGGSGAVRHASAKSATKARLAALEQALDAATASGLSA
ncbi:MAG: hypothetical protein CSB44_08280 [Gammaproteobacteria bacterium]|nr:MAG: hypothetical protein CSB44_08280 [Gammaproteobacteria bacterium]